MGARSCGWLKKAMLERVEDRAWNRCLFQTQKTVPRPDVCSDRFPGSLEGIPSGFAQSERRRHCERCSRSSEKGEMSMTVVGQNETGTLVKPPIVVFLQGLLHLH